MLLQVVELEDGNNMKILPDGTVEIRNKSTGATKVVKPDDLPSYGISYKTYQDELGAYNQSVKGITPESKADIKKKDTGREISQFLDTLEENYSQAGGATFGEGPLARILGKVEDIKGGLGMSDAASLYGNQKQGFAATLKSLTGDTGVLTDQDFERLQKLLPGLGSTPGEAKGAFNVLRSQLAAKTGEQPKETSINPEYKLGPTGNQVVDLLLGKSINTAKDIGKGIAANITEPTRQKAEQQAYATADALFTQAQKESDPVKKIALLRDAQNITQSQGQSAKEVAQSFSPDVQENPLLRGLTTGLEVTNVAALPGMASGVKDLLTNIPKSFNKQAIAEARSAAANLVDKKVSTQKFLEVGDKFVTQDPTAKKLWETQLRPALEGVKELSIPDLLEQTKVWNDAYTSAGKVGKTALAGINDALARAAKQVIRDEAPEVAKQTAKLAKLYGMENFFSKFGPALIGGAGATVGGYAAGKAIGAK